MNTTTPRLVDATGTRRRTQALAAVGWSSTAIGVRLGMRPERARNLIHKYRVQASVSPDIAARVAALYDQLAGQTGTSWAAATHAWHAHWPDPSAWIGVDIDDPDARPAPGWVRRHPAVLLGHIDAQHHDPAPGFPPAPREAS